AAADDGPPADRRAGPTDGRDPGPPDRRRRRRDPPGAADDPGAASLRLTDPRRSLRAGRPRALPSIAGAPRAQNNSLGCPIVGRGVTRGAHMARATVTVNLDAELVVEVMVLSGI